MIPLTRLPCPPILQAEGQRWTQEFIAVRAKEPGKRPPRARYAHPEVLDTLGAISSRKCFFCERKLADDERTVEHHVDVAEDPSRAFDWDNLYLACGPCNTKKLAEGTVPRTGCLDPCHPDLEPWDALDFHEEVILGVTDAGKNTIRKYRLDSFEQEGRRLKPLSQFNKVLGVAEYRIRKEGGLSAADRAVLWRVAHPSEPYSLMFRKLLENAGISKP